MMRPSVTVRHVARTRTSEIRRGHAKVRRAGAVAPPAQSAGISPAPVAGGRRVQRPVPLSDFKVPEIVLSLKKEIPSDLSLLDGAVAEITAAIDCSTYREDIECIGLALWEAIANAMIHGNHGDPARTVRVATSVNEDGDLLITVKDSGSGFDPDTIADPTAAENLLADHGRGIFLMKQIMDQVDFNFDDCTEVRMRKRRPWFE
jgi:anti-sigma regulatory factor (Ser/Thr protein kinase)